MLMSSILFKIPKSFYIRNHIIQVRDCTLDVAFKNDKALLNDLKDLKGKFEDIVK